MERMRFSVVTEAGPRRAVIVAVPLDPDRLWGVKETHAVNGTVDGRFVRGRLRRTGEGWTLTLPPMWARDAEVSVGVTVDVDLGAEGPQRGELAPDLASAFAASPQAAAFFDTLPQFYAKAYLRWIDSTSRRPELRAQRIAEVVALLQAGVKERPSSRSVTG
jgi:hypothetical protein